MTTAIKPIAQNSAHAVEQKLQSLGIVLPQPAAPIASYTGYAIAENMVFISGQLPMRDGAPQYVGKVGKDISIEDAGLAARLCAINILAQLKLAIAGDWNRVLRCVKLTGFVNGVDGFADQPKIINGASNLIGEVMGDAGKHARAAVGVSGLPLNVSVEVEAIFQLKN